MTLVSKIRQLSSLVERQEILASREKEVRTAIFDQMIAEKSDNVDSIYGPVLIRKTPVFEITKTKEILAAEAELAALDLLVKAAKKRLAALELSARPEEATSEKKVLVFNRNKAVSARAKGRRVYVTTISRKRQAKIEVGV